SPTEGKLCSPDWRRRARVQHLDDYVRHHCVLTVLCPLCVVDAQRRDLVAGGGRDPWFHDGLLWNGLAFDNQVNDRCGTFRSDRRVGMVGSAEEQKTRLSQAT